MRLPHREWLLPSICSSAGSFPVTDRKWGGCHFCFSLQLKYAFFFSLIFEMFQIKATDLSLIFHGLVLILFFSYVLIAYFWNLTKPQLLYIIRLYQRSRGFDWQKHCVQDFTCCLLSAILDNSKW